MGQRSGLPWFSSATRHILSTDLPSIGDLEKRFIFERVIVEVISKKTYAFRDASKFSWEIRYYSFEGLFLLPVSASRFRFLLISIRVLKSRVFCCNS